MHKPIKYAEKAVTMAAGAAWQVFNTFNSIRPNPSFTPKWSEKPLLKSWEKQKPPLGWHPGLAAALLLIVFVIVIVVTVSRSLSETSLAAATEVAGRRYVRRARRTGDRRCLIP